MVVVYVGFIVEQLCAQVAQVFAYYGINMAYCGAGMADMPSLLHNSHEGEVRMRPFMDAKHRGGQPPPQNKNFVERKPHHAITWHTG